MGRRKSRKKPSNTKRQFTISTAFQCPYCSHEKSVTVKVDQKVHTAYLKCNKCEEQYQTPCNYLTEPIDVYSEWRDEIERLQKPEAEAADDF